MNYFLVMDSQKAARGSSLTGYRALCFPILSIKDIIFRLLVIVKENQSLKPF